MKYESLRGLFIYGDEVLTMKKIDNGFVFINTTTLLLILMLLFLVLLFYSLVDISRIQISSHRALVVI